MQIEKEISANQLTSEKPQRFGELFFAFLHQRSEMILQKFLEAGQLLEILVLHYFNF